ncbi:hypothetical protein BXZ70DRAFT_735097 [Cristinia sonorae]|uniref:Uncharacterized protein n=1 Tax=Cristinia sonorae TaxID=1940300 RepID=A0A8K0UTH0_9AGAR|nr:hypothetical protein BXZ70DRAFT_735097 [Cristinia sonorae]
MTTRYIPHILYTVAITSIATHLLYHRKESEDQRLHISAHISLLESTLARLQSSSSSRTSASEHGKERFELSEEEWERMKRFGRTQEELERDRAAARGWVVGGMRSVGWREALLGGRREEKVREDYERRDLERVRKEIEDSAGS